MLVLTNVRKTFNLGEIGRGLTPGARKKGLDYAELIKDYCAISEYGDYIVKLSVFDEPEAGIDLWSFQNLIKVFEKMHDKTQGNIVIISHQERILDIADRIVVIANGEIQNMGTKEEILPGLLNGSLECKHNAGGCIHG